MSQCCVADDTRGNLQPFMLPAMNGQAIEFTVEVLGDPRLESLAAQDLKKEADRYSSHESEGPSCRQLSTLVCSLCRISRGIDEK